jgi:hypothetical protein
MREHTSNLTPEHAAQIMERWYSAWNAGPHGDIDRIMACYAECIEHSSPFVARFNLAQGVPEGQDGTLRGKPSVRAYFQRALTSNPTPAGATRFAPMQLTVGVGSILVLYRRWTGELAGEVFFVDGEGLIVRSVSHYG